MHQSAPPPTPPLWGRAGIMNFQLSVSRGQTWDQNYALCPALHDRKFPLNKDPNVKTLSFSLCFGDNQKVIDQHPSLAVPQVCVWGGGGGGQWLQMTGTLSRGHHAPHPFTIVQGQAIRSPVSAAISVMRSCDRFLGENWHVSV